MTRKICVVTGSRAEYGLFYPIMRKIKDSKNLHLQIVATTMHLSEDFGLTYKQIEADGFEIDGKVENLLGIDSKTAIAKSTGLAIILLSDTFERLQPDVVLLLGDRFETHAAATSAMLMNIPIAHIHGGEITEGVIDEQIRHSITKMAYMHFTSTESYRARVIQMGEPPERVFCSGAPGLDNILSLPFLDKHILEKEISWKLASPSALFTFHSETQSTCDVKQKIEQILSKIKDTELNVLFTYANADNGGRIINQSIDNFVSQNREKYHVVKSLGQLKYLSALKVVDLLIGNTSSGIIEAASFNKPVVNIGARQKGRLQSGNVINCNVDNLAESITQALSKKFIKKCKNLKNLYGDGYAAKKIVSELESQELSCIKRFYDL